MDDIQLKQLISDYSATYEKSIKNLIDFLRGANSMIAWLVGLSSATIIFGLRDVWSEKPEYLFYASIIHAGQILFAALHRIYNDSHMSSLNERIDLVNLQRILLQNDTSLVRSHSNDKLFFDLYNKIGKLQYLKDIEMTGVDEVNNSLKITKRIFAPSGVLVIVTFITIYGLFFSLLII